MRDPDLTITPQSSQQTRRRFLKFSALTTATAGAVSCGLLGCKENVRPEGAGTHTPESHTTGTNTAETNTAETNATDMKAATDFKISLAQWSLHRRHLGAENWGDLHRRYDLKTLFEKLRNSPREILRGLDNLDFARAARREFGIDAIEYVNVFFLGKAKDNNYLREMKTRAEGEGVSSRLIMCDAEGNLGDPDPRARRRAVQNHFKWVEAAAFLGCKAIRVNARSSGERDEQRRLAADGLRRLVEHADTFDIDVLVENHGGLSSDGKWLVSVMETVGHPRLGTLPDFGNFKIDEDTHYDNYLGVEEMMPYAKAVSAKSYDFDPSGEETTLDFRRLMDTVLRHGYDGYVGIEYEGDRLPEAEGIMATKRLLEKIRSEVKAA